MLRAKRFNDTKFAKGSLLAGVTSLSCLKNTFAKFFINVLLQRNIWLINFNESKCKVMHFGEKNQRANYKLRAEGSQLSSTSLEKDLGVKFSSDMKWNQQVLSCASQANSILGRLKKAFIKIQPKTF